VPSPSTRPPAGRKQCGRRRYSGAACAACGTWSTPTTAKGDRVEAVRTRAPDEALHTLGAARRGDESRQRGGGGGDTREPPRAPSGSPQKQEPGEGYPPQNEGTARGPPAGWMLVPALPNTILTLARSFSFPEGSGFKGEPPDVLALLRLLNEHEVRYLVTGSATAMIHGPTLAWDDLRRVR
jgi:hypothetical protein